MQKRLKIDPDGNVRVYSRQRMGENEWYVSWQAISDSCKVHGICVANSTCKYDTKEGRKCSCLPGYRVKNHRYWSYGCEPKFETLSCHINNSTFLKLPDVELYGYDYALKKNISYKNCVDSCLRDCECRAFQYTFRFDSGFFKCYTKGVLFNGRRSPSFEGVTYLRLPINNTFFSQEESAIENGHVCSVKLERAYAKKHESNFVKFFLWLSVAIGVFEILCVFLTWCFLFRTKRNSDLNRQGYNTLAAPGCRKFTYSELKQATKRFSEEIGRGAGGIVYKGVLSDQRIAAIKKLYNNNGNINESKQGEGEFLAEVSIIGRLNHMNLIQMWGYCVEGKQRLLAYEYMENGSLAENLNSNTLDWSKRYNIALGTARVLAYLHEECLEWILHCDIKPQNILLDSNYEPKVADFGLSKLLNRNNDGNTGSFSMIRGTRGYMAPEWVFNLPITSKVDVYSYGIVVLEMITGRSATTGVQNVGGEEAESCGRLVTWVREKRDKTTRGGVSFWVEQIVDPAIELKDEFEARKVETLARVASECVEDDKDARPTMSQVVEMLQSQENDES